MALQRVRSLAATRFKTDAEANAFTPAFGELVTVFEKGGYRGLRIGNGSTRGGLSVGEYILPIIAAPPPPEGDSAEDTGTDTTPVVDTGPQTWAQQQAEQLAADEDEYDKTFFVPERARWCEIKDFKHDIGAELNKAIAAIEEYNPDLDGVLSSIDFTLPFNFIFIFFIFIIVYKS